MSGKTPLVSVCIPAYNCGKYVKQTLRCLLAQAYTNTQLIIVNDGSADDTLAAVQSIEDDRLLVIDTANGGAARARNMAYNKATGQYIIFFDADDYIEPDFIAKQLNKAIENPDAVILSGWGRFYNDDIDTFKADPMPAGAMTFVDWIKKYWYHSNPMTTPGRIIIPKHIVDAAGLWNEELSLNDDMEFFTRVFLKADKLIFNPAATFYYRSGIQGLSGTKSLKAYESYYNSIALSVAHVLASYKQDPALSTSCANLWQLFMYEVYPLYPQLLKKVQANISQLGGSALPYPGGKTAKILSGIIGWKNVKRLQAIL